MQSTMITSAGVQSSCFGEGGEERDERRGWEERWGVNGQRRERERDHSPMCWSGVGGVRSLGPALCCCMGVEAVVWDVWFED